MAHGLFHMDGLRQDDDLMMAMTDDGDGGTPFNDLIWHEQIDFFSMTVE